MLHSASNRIGNSSSRVARAGRRLGCLGVALVLVNLSAGLAAAGEVRKTLAYAPAPVDNPLKGLVPYAGAGGDRFPHSMEFGYVPLSALCVAEGRHDWARLDSLLNRIARAGRQGVFRVYLEYPGKTDGIPPFLVAGGLKVHEYEDRSSGRAVTNRTPDYADPNLRNALKAFIAALGARYDGDPRVGFITAGLLGHWGEWHCHPRADLFAPRDVQQEVLDAFEAAFKKTPVLLRYPVGNGDPTKAPNVRRPFGYHDDSFAWATLDTGRNEDSWFFLAALRASGPEGLMKWQKHPIGGEIRPEAWGRVFDEQPGDPQVQDFSRCVRETHVSWLMDSGIFRPDQPESRLQRAERLVSQMGYEFHVRAVSFPARATDKLPVTIEVENRGVAPFYHDWQPEFGLIANGKLLKRMEAAGRLTGLLPGTSREWQETLDLQGLEPRSYTLAVRVANPLPNGRPVRFANTSQDANLPAWLSLGELWVGDR